MKHPEVDGSTNFHQIKVRTFTSTTQPSDEAIGLTYGQFAKAKITNYTINVEPKTGLLVSRFLTMQVDIQVEKGIGGVLPLPDLTDEQLNKPLISFQVNESVVLNPDAFKTEFDFVDSITKYNTVSSIFQISFLGIFTLVTIVLTVIYCNMNKRQESPLPSVEDNNERENEAIAEALKDLNMN